jgi:phosphomannomutase
VEEFVVDILRTEGRRLHRLGIVPTPTIQTWIARRRLPGGIAVTASHNPAGWHGVKFLGADGLTLDATLFYREALSGGAPLLNGHHTAAPPLRWMHHQAIAEHLRSLFRPGWLRSLADAVAYERFHVVVDAVNASASFVLPSLLQQLRCRVTLLHADGSGVFPHPPEPLPQHLHELSQWVHRYRADIGIAVDPDADRLVLVDETGQCLWEELTIVLAAQAVLEHKRRACGKTYEPTVVVNYSTTSAVDTVAQRYGAQVLRAPVGEANVVRRLQESRGVVGGEGSGGVILPHVHYGRDALVGSLLVLGLLALRQRRLSELVAELPHPVMRKYRLEQPRNFPTVLERIASQVTHQAREIRRDDGLYVRLGNGWFHLRASNTEPIVRLIVEAPEQAELEQLEALVLPLLHRG